MYFMKMLEELKEERDRVGQAITVLERLAAGQGRRRGRPPQWIKNLREQSPEPKTKKQHKRNGTARSRRFSAATRRKMAASQRRRWAKVRWTKSRETA